MNASFPSRRAASAGTTLLEMLLVLAILGLVATIVAPGLASRERSEDLRTIGNTLTAKLSAARLRAIVSGRPVRVVLDPGLRKVTFEQGRELQLPKVVTLSVVTGRETVIARSQAVLVFLPNGSSTGAEVTLAKNTETLRLKVHWLTGLVTDRTWSP